ncbi:phasin family protein [Pseudoroseomonas oryzae]|uniref:Phasin family protein n=2 Tax=Teichococcus oryzae TaxID=1608942 RepID=A0A5B2TDR6_9PROT|nr:phasin family protein [Pseudoroseomonas oryzae]
MTNTTDTLQAEAEKTRTAMERSMDQATRTADGFYKATEEAMEFGRGNVEAFTKATQTYMTGMQELSKQAFTVMQSLNEQALQNAKALAAVKSLRDAMEMQANFAKSQLEKGVAEATKLNEAAFKLAEQSSAPIAARMTLAMERLARPATPATFQ